MNEIHPNPKKKAIRLKGKEIEKLRRQVAERAKYRCQKCGGPASWEKGHMAHIKSRGSGGSDTLENTQWECFNCHIVEGHLKWRSDKKERGI